jgi:hypothetical protein
VLAGIGWMKLLRARPAGSSTSVAAMAEQQARRHRRGEGIGHGRDRLIECELALLDEAQDRQARHDLADRRRLEQRLRISAYCDPVGDRPVAHDRQTRRRNLMTLHQAGQTAAFLGARARR